MCNERADYAARAAWCVHVAMRDSGRARLVGARAPTEAERPAGEVGHGTEAQAGSQPTERGIFTIDSQPLAHPVAGAEPLPAAEIGEGEIVHRGDEARRDGQRTACGGDAFVDLACFEQGDGAEMRIACFGRAPRRELGVQPLGFFSEARIEQEACELVDILLVVGVWTLIGIAQFHAEEPMHEGQIIALRAIEDQPRDTTAGFGIVRVET